MSSMQTPASVLANSYESQLALNPEDSVPPVQAYITADTVINISYACAVAGQILIVNARILLPDGTVMPCTWQVPMSSDRSRNGITYQLAEGFLLSLTCGTSTQPGNQRVYAWIRLQARGQGVQLLCAGYPTQGRILTWPQATIDNEAEGAGAIVSVTGTTPGAGAEISETVPSNARWELLSIKYSLTTSATVATRNTSLLADDGSNVFWQGTQSGSGQAASLTYQYCHFPGATQVAGQSVIDIFASPTGLQLTAGFRLRTNTLNLQAGDQYTAPQYLVREWLTP